MSPQPSLASFVSDIALDELSAPVLMEPPRPLWFVAGATIVTWWPALHRAVRSVVMPGLKKPSSFVSRMSSAFAGPGAMPASASTSAIVVVFVFNMRSSCWMWTPTGRRELLYARPAADVHALPPGWSPRTSDLRSEAFNPLELLVSLDSSGGCEALHCARAPGGAIQGT